MNYILSHGEVPTQWKQALVHPLPKESGGFRPISLLNCLSKIMDRLILDRMEAEIDDRRIQFGCRRAHSTQQAISRLLHVSSEAAKDDKFFLMFSLDLSKAYDRMDTSKLITKLLKLQVSSYLIIYIDSWLRQRTFQVRVNGVLSNEFTLHQGLPQGSPLSVGLWKLYVSDLPVHDNNCQAFMDDIVFWESVNSYEEARLKLQQWANDVEYWLNDHQMLLNSQKSKLLSNKDPIIRKPLVIQNCHYYPVQQLRYLGANLSTSPDGPDINIDLSNVKPDLKRRCAILSKVSKWLPSKMCLLFGKSIILGKLNFYLSFIGAESKETLQPLQIGLNEAMRFITGAFKTTPIPLLHSKSGIPPLQVLINKAAGSMWTSLHFQPNCLSDDYDNWEAQDNNGTTPLGALWKFEYELIHNFYPRRDNGSLFDTDGYTKVTIDQSRSLFSCKFTNTNLTRTKALELHSNGSLYIPQGDYTIWTDGSKKKHHGASGICCVSQLPGSNSTTGISYLPIFSSFEIEVCAIRDGLLHLKDNFDVKGKKNCSLY